MSVLESVCSDDIPEVEDWPFKPVTVSKQYGYSTIPLHPLLLRGLEDVILTKENYLTFEQTEETVKRSVEEWGPSIGYVKDDLITYELCSLALSNHSGAICSIRPHLLTKEDYYKLCLQSVKKGGWNLEEIPDYVQTQELCDAAINHNCWAIKFCKEEYKTRENCGVAIMKNGQTIKHIPTTFIDETMCRIAIKTRYECLNLIPKEFITSELCEEAVRANGRNVKHVPEKFMSKELAFLAVQSPSPEDTIGDTSGANIQHIPAKFLTKETIVESAKRWYSTYRYVPKECITEEIENAVLEVEPFCILYVTKTPERCLQAIKKRILLIQKLPREVITQEMAEYILGLPEDKKEWINHDVLEYLDTLV